jgi:phosphate transporter
VIWLPVFKDEPAQQNCLAVVVAAALLWTTEALPLYVTSMAIPLMVVMLRCVLDDTDGHRLSAPKVI